MNLKSSLIEGYAPCYQDSKIDKNKFYSANIDQHFLVKIQSVGLPSFKFLFVLFFSCL